MPVCVNGSCNHNTQTCRRKNIIKVNTLKYYQHTQLFTVSLLSAASTNVLSLQTLVFHLQTNLEAFQDIFSVSLACFKFEVLLCIYVICTEQKMILNIWVVFLKSDKKQIEYLPVTITELFNVYKKFRISNSFPSKFKLLYSDQWWHPCFTCLNITEWNSSLFKQIWRISYGLKHYRVLMQLILFEIFSPFPTFTKTSLKSKVLKNHSHDRSWMTEVKTNLSPCFRRKSWRMKTRNATQQRIVDRIMAAWTAWIDWYSAKTRQPWLKIISLLAYSCKD